MDALPGEVLAAPCPAWLRPPGATGRGELPHSYPGTGTRGSAAQGRAHRRRQHRASAGQQRPAGPQSELYGTFQEPLVRVMTEGGIEERAVVLGNSDDFWGGGSQWVGGGRPGGYGDGGGRHRPLCPDQAAHSRRRRGSGWVWWWRTGRRRVRRRRFPKAGEIDRPA